jgi:23S rRNA (cytidine1920-2'-O)/16S rRNA (cytidine1409-2'-O)-methyltransferase
LTQKPKKERLDKVLVDRGLAENRTRAQALILAGKVYSDTERLEKPGLAVNPELELSVREGLPYVSRGGLKLEAALEAFGIDVQGRRCLDIGASTGGFTDCLLQKGALNVVALDVGHGQIAWKLRQDERVELREHVNARYLRPDDFSFKFDLVVCDVSFISLKLIVPVIPELISEGARIVTLVKPQFEVGRDEVGKGGIVRDEAAQERVLREVCECAHSVGLAVIGTIDSPITGQDGNREFLAAFGKREILVKG